MSGEVPTGMRSSCFSSDRCFESRKVCMGVFPKQYLLNGAESHCTHESMHRHPPAIPPGCNRCAFATRRCRTRPGWCDESARKSHWSAFATAPQGDAAARSFKITHPFHPLHGYQFELIAYKSAWGEDRVYFYN